jgi:hypothetical protein
MSEFASQGIKLVHPNKNIEKFYQRWFEKVDGNEISERFLNYLYRTGNVFVKRREGKVNVKTEEKWRRSQGFDDDIVLEEPKIKKRTLPLQYNFLNPLTVEVIGGDLAIFIGKPIYALKVTSSLTALFKQRLPAEQTKKILEQIPEDIKKALTSGAKFILLDEDKLEVSFYKKDDWLSFANPMTAKILDNLIMLEKMHLADMSALDGAISNVRLWNLGVLDGPNSIIPNKTALNRLRNILANNVTGGVLDLVWGPELAFKESATQVHHFLKAEKYQQVMTELYEGLGVPPTLTGGGSGGGFTNNSISMQTFIKRLQYGRNKLIKFWKGEIKRVQKAMGFRFPAQIQFDQMILADEAAEKKLVLDLIDRDIISSEAIERFNFIPEIEKQRIKREQRDRLSDKIPPKAGPYHNPHVVDDLVKLFVQRGHVSPSEVGVELEDKKDGEKSPNEEMANTQVKLAETKPKGVSGEGRPLNSKDTDKRKQKTVKPRTAASKLMNTFVWANTVQEEIAEIVNPAILGTYKKKNMRSLTAKEKEVADYLNFSVLCNLEPYKAITQEMVYNILDNNLSVNAEIISMCKILANEFIQRQKRDPNLDEVKQIQSLAYAMQLEEE